MPHEGGASALDQIASYLGDHSSKSRQARAAAVQRFFGAEVVTLHTAAALTPADICAWIAAERRAGVNYGPISSAVHALGTFYEHLNEGRRLTSDPTADRGVEEALEALRKQRGPRLKRRATREVYALSPAEVVRLLDAVKAGEATTACHHAYLLFLVATGLSREEVLALDHEDVRAEGDGGVLTLRRPHGAEVEEVRLPAPVMRALEGMREAYGFDRGAIFRNVTKNGRWGAAMSENTTRHIVYAALQRAGLRQARKYMMEHYGGALVLEEGSCFPHITDPRDRPVIAPATPTARRPARIRTGWDPFPGWN